jgi:cell division transport system permease protein
VGATDAFVRRPFLIEGFAKGVLGGALALLLTWMANTLISKAFIKTDFFPFSLAFLGILGGALIGGFGSALSVGRHLKRIH